MHTQRLAQRHGCTLAYTHQRRDKTPGEREIFISEQKSLICKFNSPHDNGFFSGSKGQRQTFL